MSTQAEIDEINQTLLATVLKRIQPGEIVGAVVTVRTDAKGLGWYPASADSSQLLLEMLRKKPDEVHVRMELRRR